MKRVVVIAAVAAREVAMMAWGLLFLAFLFLLYVLVVVALGELGRLLEALMWWDPGSALPGPGPQRTWEP